MVFGVMPHFLTEISSDLLAIAGFLVAASIGSIAGSTFGALRIQSFSAIQFCDTVVRLQILSANATFRASAPGSFLRSSFKPRGFQPVL